jgi:flagellar motor switch protein FliN
MVNMTADLLPACAPPAQIADPQQSLDLEIDLGAPESRPTDLVKLREHDIVPLDKPADEPVDLLVNGHVVARGHLVLLNDIVCVRVSEVLHDGIRTVARAHELK